MAGPSPGPGCGGGAVRRSARCLIPRSSLRCITTSPLAATSSYSVLRDHNDTFQSSRMIKRRSSSAVGRSGFVGGLSRLRLVGLVQGRRPAGQKGQGVLGGGGGLG